jgi:hypothetical protein
MDITINENEPEDSVDRYTMDTYVPGEEQLFIPPHWHKVSQQKRALHRVLNCQAQSFNNAWRIIGACRVLDGP